MRIRSALVTITLVVGFVVLPGAVAQATPPTSSFGSHVRACAREMHFSGGHNPGMHRGAAGWSGAPCH